jgi:CRISPR-associated protein Csy2
MKTLLLPHIRIQNANALSSPYTIGFPAVTAWLGAMHALERKLQKEFPGLHFASVGIISHRADLHTYRGPGDYVHSIIGTANPLDKNGKRPSFIEEARINLDVTLVAEVEGISRGSWQKKIPSKVEKLLQCCLKMAGGDILKIDTPLFQDIDRPVDLLRITGPGYALLERKELMQKAMEEGKDALEALIESLAIHHRCIEEDGNKRWQSTRKYEGWLVPIAVGFMGISPVGKALNARDPDTLHRFAESVVTLGEFRMPHRVESLDEMMWRYRYDERKSLYLCETKNQIKE